MTLAANSTRGGVVRIGGGSVTPVFNNPYVIADGGCYTGPDKAEWEAVGKPESWCNPRQCEGDADGLQEGSVFTGFYWVGVGDLNLLISGWKNQNYTNEAECPWIAADFDHKQEGSVFTGYYRVGVGDLNILIANWKSDANIQANCLD